MFTNIGAKIKGLAKAGCWVGIVGCIFAGVVLLFTEEEFIPIALGVAVGGSLASWIGSWFLYGFGQLIENSDVLVELKKSESEGEKGGRITHCPHCNKRIVIPESIDNPVCPWCEEEV